MPLALTEDRVADQIRKLANEGFTSEELAAPIRKKIQPLIAASLEKYKAQRPALQSSPAPPLTSEMRNGISSYS